MWHMQELRESLKEEEMRSQVVFFPFHILGPVSEFIADVGTDPDTHQNVTDPYPIKVIVGKPLWPDPALQKKVGSGSISSKKSDPHPCQMKIRIRIRIRIK